MTEVRIATVDDAQKIFLAILDVREETNYVHFNFLPEKAFKSVVAWIQKPNSVMFVAEKDSEVAGILAGGIFNHWLTDDACASEEVFFVRKKYRSQGIAALLLDAFMKWAESKCKHIFAGVTTGCGKAAEHLYLKHGMSCMGGNFIKHV